MTRYRGSIFLLLLMMMMLVVGISSAENNNAIEISGRPLTISQGCAPKSRSRHTVDIDSITLSCYDEDGNMMQNNEDYYSDSSSSSSICSIGETGKLTVDCKYTACLAYSIYNYYYILLCSIVPLLIFCVCVCVCLLV